MVGTVPFKRKGRSAMAKILVVYYSRTGNTKKMAELIGGAFSSAANIGGGNETTILSILQAMLIHGMIVQGNPKGDHYGPVSIGSPDERVKKQCRELGQRVASLVKKLK